MANFHRAIGKFTDYCTKVISVLKRKGVEENHELDLGLIARCYGNSIPSAHCADLYINSMGLKENTKLKTLTNLLEKYSGKKVELVEGPHPKLPGRLPQRAPKPIPGTQVIVDISATDYGADLDWYAQRAITFAAKFKMVKTDLQTNKKAPGYNGPSGGTNRPSYSNGTNRILIYFNKPETLNSDQFRKFADLLDSLTEVDDDEEDGDSGVTIEVDYE
jgi:hypothetical protein